MKILVFSSIKEIAKENWARVAPPDFPFASSTFLSALEETGCLGERTGWTPIYVTVWDAKKLCGAMVTFVKNNSYGEYIFDFAWANAYEQTGLSYYPKLVSAIPFTPATGPKLLVDPALDEEMKANVRLGLIRGGLELAEKLQLSSTHALFITAGEQDAFLKSGFFIRHSFQYHWHNDGFENFTSFLKKFRSRRRKEIVRERAQVEKSGVRLSRLTGSDLKAEHAEKMFRFYLDTVQKRGGFDYLTCEFFKRVFSEMPEQIMFATAENTEGAIVAGAVNYIGTETLFGRNWGCIEDYRALHFELCYYQGIEFAIERKLKLFEAGAQGEHKFQRGFLPALTFSAHRLESKELDEPIRAFVKNEKRQIENLFIEYQAQTPFSRETDSSDQDAR